MEYRIDEIGNYIKANAAEMIEAGGEVEVLVNQEGQPTGWRAVKQERAEEVPTAEITRISPPAVPIRFPQICFECVRGEPHDSCPVESGNAVPDTEAAITKVLQDLINSVSSVEECYNEWLRQTR